MTGTDQPGTNPTDPYERLGRGFASFFRFADQTGSGIGAGVLGLFGLKPDGTSGPCSGDDVLDYMAAHVNTVVQRRQYLIQEYADEFNRPLGVACEIRLLDNLAEGGVGGYCKCRLRPLVEYPATPGVFDTAWNNVRALLTQAPE